MPQQSTTWKRTVCFQELQNFHLFPDVVSGYVDSQGYRWKKSPKKTDAPGFSEEEMTISTMNFNQIQPELIQTDPLLGPEIKGQYEGIRPTPILSQESFDTEKPLFPSPTQEEDLAMTEKPLYETKPVDLEPVNELVSDLNHLLDGLKENGDKDKVEKPEKCVLKKNLESCDIYLCSMIRSMLAVPFPDCYAVKSYYRKLNQ